jgi:hypothetical protein
LYKRRRHERHHHFVDRSLRPNDSPCYLIDDINSADYHLHGDGHYDAA